jgi:hypothetical protein
MKRYAALALACIALFALAAPAFSQAQVFVLKAPIASQPALLTSVGQSADVEMVKVLMTRAKLQFTLDSQIKADKLKATGAKTLVLAIGGSSKGLGAAGISAEAEIDRAKAVMAEARKLGMKIIGLHVGGEARRGELSDKFIVASIASCDYVIVVSEGDKDGLFEKLCGKIPLDKVEKISGGTVPLAAAFLK